MWGTTSVKRDPRCGGLQASREILGVGDYKYKEISSVWRDLNLSAGVTGVENKRGHLCRVNCLKGEHQSEVLMVQSFKQQ